MDKDFPLDTNRPRVLIVDDDPAVLSSLMDEMSMAYEVTASSSGEAALELLCRQQFDAIISDVRMPGVDGVAVIRQAQAIDPNMVRILLTGYSDEAALEAAWVSGGAYKLGKPWGEELDIVLRRALEQRQGMQQTQAKLEAERQARDRAERAATRLNRMASMGTLLAGVVHELRSPLTYLGANFEWLEDKVSEIIRLLQAFSPDPSSPQGTAEGLARAAELKQHLEAGRLLTEFEQICQECGGGLTRLTEIIDDLRCFSAPSRRSRFRPADITRCAQRAASMVACQYKHDVKIEVQVAPDVGEVAGHEGELTQVLVNLMLNGVQAMGGRGTVRLVASRLADKGVAIDVEDEGPGIPEENRSQLFEPFFTTKEENGGSGLGLAISRDIARRHGGELSYIDRPGKGAAFRLYLPPVGPASAESD